MKLLNSYKIVAKCSDQRLGNIILQLKIKAGTKNDYYIFFYKTNIQGESCLHKSDIYEQFKVNQEIFMMDYNGTIETANPIVEISLLEIELFRKSLSIIRTLGLSSYDKKLWNNIDEKIDYFLSSDNDKFLLEPIHVDFEKSTQILIELLNKK
jgi:hypothetical protein